MDRFNPPCQGTTVSYRLRDLVYFTNCPLCQSTVLPYTNLFTGLLFDQVSLPG